MIYNEFGNPVFANAEEYLAFEANKFKNIQTLTGQGVFFDETSPYTGYDFAEIAALRFTPGDSVQGIDAANFYRYHYLTPDELNWAQVKYTKTDGVWKASSAVAFGSEQSGNFGNFLKFAAPIFLMAIPGVGQAIGATAFSAVGVTVSPAIAAAVGNVAVSTALNGGDIERAVTSALAGGLGAVAGGFVGSAVDSAFVGRVVASATRAAATGGDMKTAVLSTLADTGVKAMQDFDFASFDFLATGPQEEQSFDWLAPASGSVKYDTEVFSEYGLVQPDGWSISTQQAIDNYMMGLGTVDTSSLITGYHDPVYTENDVIDQWDTNYGVPSGYGNSDFPTYEAPLPPFVEPGAPWINTPSIQIGQQQQTQETDWVGSIVTGVTALAAAAMKLIPTIQALRNGDVIKSGSMNAGGETVTANANGTITTRNTTTGATNTTIPQVGKAYQTPDGSIITNNGNGTYTVIRPDGSRYTGNYNTNSAGTLVGGATGGGGFFDDPKNVMLAGGAALLALLVLKGN